MRGSRTKASPERLLAMRAYYLDGHTLEQTGQQFEVPYNFLWRVFSREGWIRPPGPGNRVKPTTLSRCDDGALLTFKQEWDRLDSTVKGSIAEGYVKVKLASLGFDVWEPATQNHRTDLLALFGRRVLKLQVKSAGYDAATKSFRTNLTRHRRAGGHPNYVEDDVDFFLVYCASLPALEVYVIPVAVVSGNSTPRLFPHRDMAFKIRKISWEAYRNAFHLLTEAASL